MPRAVVAGCGSVEDYFLLLLFQYLGFETLAYGFDPSSEGLDPAIRAGLEEAQAALGEPSIAAVTCLSSPQERMVEAIEFHALQGYPLILSESTARTLLGLAGLNPNLAGLLAGMLERLGPPVPVQVRDSIIVYRGLRQLPLAARELVRAASRSGLTAYTPSMEYLRSIGRFEPAEGSG
ncbi:MAG: hypothetical protein LRS48_00780 [Desulfurococcales archaeon]|nr:hypothetical protein [Desulfurococcales archaeon]